MPNSAGSSATTILHRFKRQTRIIPRSSQFRQAAGYGTYCAAFFALIWSPAAAHGPLFSPAPETIWKGGTEVTLGYYREETGPAREQKGFLEAKYGLTERWEIVAAMPYVSKHKAGMGAQGIGDLTLGTKYQFWRRDLPGAQYKAASFLKIKLPSAKGGMTPTLGGGSTDVIAGLTAGYESRRWYWFASSVYRLNTKGDIGLEKGDRQSLNIVGGIRPVLSEYDEPDTVLMLELNWERDDRTSLNGQPLGNTGGWKLFVSPVLWWTYRQVAVRGGVQMLLTEKLNGEQPSPDYRAKFEIVYHF